MAEQPPLCTQTHILPANPALLHPLTYVLYFLCLALLQINSLISESERLQREASQAESELSPLEGERQQKAEQRTRARAGMQVCVWSSE
jgi:hypothetical protein